MLEGVDQYEATIGPHGTLTIPATLLERQGWKVGSRLLLEETDEGVLMTEMSGLDESA